MASQRLERELAMLSEFARDERQPGLKRAEAALVLHQRAGISGCLCGWARLGESFAAHQAEALAELGLLR